MAFVIASCYSNSLRLIWVYQCVSVNLNLVNHLETLIQRCRVSHMHLPHRYLDENRRRTQVVSISNLHLVSYQPPKPNVLPPSTRWMLKDGNNHQRVVRKKGAINWQRRSITHDMIYYIIFNFVKVLFTATSFLDWTLPWWKLYAEESSSISQES